MQNKIAEHVQCPKFRYDFELVRADGTVERWSFENLVTTAGKNDLLDKYFAGSGYTAAWYLGLISSASYGAGPAAGDTMSSHSGWTEAGPTNAPNYAAGSRPALSWNAAAAGSKQTSAAVSYTFSNGGTVKGAFIASNATKDGTTGVLYSAGTFADKVVSASDVLNVSVTVSA
jgi:hypothetical protein